MIKIENLSKSYPGAKKAALDNLNLVVEPGKITGFLGPNGAGKSTTLNILVGLLEESAGSVEILGKNIKDYGTELNRKIGYVADGAIYYPGLTGAKFLKFLGEMYEIEPAVLADRVRPLAEQFSFVDDLDKKIAAYSHGMNQKLSIIAALIHNPEVFILDEPQGGLDPKSNFVLKNIMRSYCDQGKTVFFSTHVLDVAERICDEIAIIKEGRLVAEGNLAELRAKSGSDGSLENLFLQLTEEAAPIAMEENNG